MFAHASLIILILCGSGWCGNYVVLVSSLNEEAIALLSFKSSIKFDPEGSLNSWNSSDDNPCSWNGITCREQRVVSVSIPRKKLSGSLSPSLGSLSELRHVNLRNNELYGELSPEIFKARGLQSLVLYGNSFSGSLPSEVEKLQYLQILDLSQNLFNGSLPTSLVQCKRLRILDFSHNNFTGSLPTGIGKRLISLEKFDLSFNEFNGPVPDDLGYLSNLQGTLDLSHNMFSGSIPANLGNLPEKVYIDLTYNDLSGPIPQTGALINRGPTAFVGNPRLCGPPLKNLCPSNTTADSPPPFPYLPGNYPPQGGGGHGLSRAALVAIIVGDVIAICLIGLIFSYCRSRICFCCCKKKQNHDNKGHKSNNECLCFTKDESSSEKLSENIEERYHDLVPLDKKVEFDLEELLKASAFVLGKSGTGIVYKVVLEDGVTLAVRRLGEGGAQRFKEFQTEVEAIAKVRHRNIVALRAYYFSVDEKLLIYDYVPNGNLSSAIHGNPGMVTFTPLSWSTRMKIMKGISRGILHLHEHSPKKYVHGDLKPSKILLGHEMEPKISDFGLNRLANIAMQRTQQAFSSNTFTASSLYRAPEAVKVAKPSQKWDVYSFGMILLEMITGKPPIVEVGNSEVDLVRWMEMCIDDEKPVSEVLDPNLADDVDREEEMIAALKISLACTRTCPEERPTMRHVCEALEKIPASDD